MEYGTNEIIVTSEIKELAREMDIALNIGEKAFLINYEDECEFIVDFSDIYIQEGIDVYNNFPKLASIFEYDIYAGLDGRRVDQETMLRLVYDKYRDEYFRHTSLICASLRKTEFYNKENGYFRLIKKERKKI